MRKDSIRSDAIEKAYLIFSERGLEIQDYAHKPTDYARGTVMEPQHTSNLRANFGEYDDLGKRCQAICGEVESLQEAMKISRTRGNFQALQKQMKLINNLTKEKTAIEAKMATIDLARAQHDQHLKMVGEEVSYAEQIESVSARIADLEARLFNYSEEQQ